MRDAPWLRSCTNCFRARACMRWSGLGTTVVMHSWPYVFCSVGVMPSNGHTRARAHLHWLCCMATTCLAPRAPTSGLSWPLRMWLLMASWERAHEEHHVLTSPTPLKESTQQD